MTTATADDLREACDAGQKAGADGASVLTCPYPAGDLRRAMWLRHFVLARTA